MSVTELRLSMYETRLGLAYVHTWVCAHSHI